MSLLLVVVFSLFFLIWFFFRMLFVCLYRVRFVLILSFIFSIVVFDVFVLVVVVAIPLFLSVVFFSVFQSTSFLPPSPVQRIVGVLQQQIYNVQQTIKWWTPIPGMHQIILHFVYNCVFSQISLALFLHRYILFSFRSSDFESQ